jgi:hypothetical protein
LTRWPRAAALLAVAVLPAVGGLLAAATLLNPGHPSAAAGRRSRSCTALRIARPDATAITDGGGLARAVRRPIEGGEQIARA